MTITQEKIQAQHIRIQPYDISILHDLRITREINDHVHAHFFGSLITGDQEKIDGYLNDSQTVITINHVDDSGNTVRNLFTGIAISVKIHFSGQNQTIDVEAVSSTWLMDVRQRKRSFQDKGMTYNDLVSAVTAAPGYDAAPQSNVKQALSGKAIENIIVQHRETDWQFLARVASRCNDVIVADAGESKPRFWFGLPEGQTIGRNDLENDVYFTCGKELNACLKRMENHSDGTSAYQ
jgi:hypothetical protein